LTEADLTNITPEARAHALKEFRRYRAGSIYTPPSLQGTLTQPGHLGGAQWHGASYDPLLNVLYVNVNDAPTINRLRPVYNAGGAATATPAEVGREIYQRTCAACHGADREGTPPLVPSLVNADVSRQALQAVVVEGRNSMPAFSHFRAAEVNALAAYLARPPDPAGAPATGRTPDRYTIDQYVVFTDPHGVPATAPPWGTLNAIDLSTGDLVWRVPLGEYPQLVAKGIRNTGTMNYGGAVATAGGLVFVAATADEKFRAFESRTGRLLWEHQLPAGGYATPSVYMANGRQFVVIAAGGGGKNATQSGDSIVAFALPEDPAVVAARPAAPSSITGAQGAAASGWIDLFDGATLDGWVHLNGGHQFTVEDGAIVGRTSASSASMNSFLVTTREYGDFELELQTMVDRVTNQGIQIRSRAKPLTTGRGFENTAGRVHGPQVEVRRTYPGLPPTGVLYGEALGTGWLTSQDKIKAGHRFFVDDGWNHVRIVARGPRIQTWVNGQPVEDLVHEGVYTTNPSGFIGLQIHGIGEREITQAGEAAAGLTVHTPLVNRWRNIRIRPLASSPGDFVPRTP
jgi:quinoprotein glucose dehydrogenase